MISAAEMLFEEADSPGSTAFRSGFTLIELLIAAVLTSLVMTAIGSCVFAGMRTWDCARRFGTGEADGLMKLEIMQKDLANSFLFPGIGFNGTSKDISFAGLVGAMPEDGVVGERIGTIRYFVSDDGKALYRKMWQYPAKEPEDGRSERMISRLTGFQISYYSLPVDGTSAGMWQEGFVGVTNLPGAVSIVLSFEGSDRPVTVKRTVLIPMAFVPVKKPEEQKAARK